MNHLQRAQHCIKSSIKRSTRHAIAVLCLLLSYACGGPPAHAHWHPAYLHDADIDYRNPDWMAALDDSVRLSRLSLPGTHQSMSFYGGDAVATQSLPLRIQLEAGIRVFDMRLRVTGTHMALHHGPFFQHAMLGDVLLEMNTFLKQHPGETLLVRVREEHTAEPGSLPFGVVFQRYRQEYGIGVPVEDDPALGKVRGKIVILQNFSTSAWHGIPFKRFRIQDNFDVGTIWGQYQKWLDVKAHFKAADTRRHYQITYVNFLSGTGGGVFPYFVASGHSNPATGAARLATGLTTLWGGSSYPDFPRVSCFLGICTIAYEGTNVLAQQYIRDHQLNYVGMVLADFPGPGLIDTIIERNFTPCRSWQAGGTAVAGEVYRYENPYTRTVDYFRARHASPYGALPLWQGSNGDWTFLGHGKVCRW